MVILVGCPMIGFYSAFGSTFSTFVNFIYSTLKAVVYLLSSVFGKQFGMIIFNNSMFVYEYILDLIENTDCTNLTIREFLIMFLLEDNLNVYQELLHFVV